MMIRCSVTVKGDVADYVKKEMERTGEAAGTVCKNLVTAGMEYKQGLSSLAALAAALDTQKEKE
jgi:hypothetical protein